MTWKHKADTVGESLATFLSSRPLHWEEQDGLWRAGVEFWKWCGPWDVSVLARGKPSANNRRAVERVLRSIVFPPLPVVLDEQALQRAYAALPHVAKARGALYGVHISLG